MSETYQSKRERWQRLLNNLPEGLREHVSLRNVEAVASLPTSAQERLMEAINAGLKRLPSAIEQLKRDPNTPIGVLLNPPSQASFKEEEGIIHEVTDLIQQSFPDMSRIAAEALARADAMEIPRTIALVHAQLFHSKHLKTDFVMLVVFRLMHKTLERLEEILVANPAFGQIVQQGLKPWEIHDRRK